MPSTNSTELGVHGDPGGDDLLNDRGLAQRLARKLPPRLDAERRLECVQEAILVLLVRLAAGGQVADREAFIVGVARRLACKQLNRRRSPSLDEAFGPGAGPPDRRDPEAEQDRIARRLWVACALDQLTSEERQLLLAHFAQELSFGAIGRQLGIPGRTVQWRVHAAMKHLRAALDRLPKA